MSRSSQLATALLCLSSACAPVPSPHPIVKERIPLTDFVEGLKTVNVTINNQKMKMIFDTGAGMVVLTSAAAARAGCTIYDDATGYRSDGMRLDVKICGTLDAQLGTVEKRITSAIVGDFFGDPSPVDGMISLQALENVPFEIDLAGNELTLHPGTDGIDVARSAAWTEVSIQLGRDVGGLALEMYLGLVVDSHRNWVEFDSGSSEPLMLRPSAARALGLTGQEGDIDVRLSDEVTLSTHAVLRETLIYDGLLGAPDISKHRWLIDLHNQRAWISTD